MRHIFLGLSFLFSLFLSCSSGEPEMKYTDLLSYGVPIQIQTPDSVKITTSDMGIQKDLVLKGEGGYHLQIFYSDAFRNQKAAVEEQKDILKASPFFKEFIREDPKGFIYSLQLDSTLENYGFRYIVVKGEKEISIQSGMGGIYSRERIEKLYDYAQNIK